MSNRFFSPSQVRPGIVRRRKGVVLMNILHREPARAFTTPQTTQTFSQRSRPIRRPPDEQTNDRATTLINDHAHPTHTSESPANTKAQAARPGTGPEEMESTEEKNAKT